MMNALFKMLAVFLPWRSLEMKQDKIIDDYY